MGVELSKIINSWRRLEGKVCSNQNNLILCTFSTVYIIPGSIFNSQLVIPTEDIYFRLDRSNWHSRILGPFRM